ncbi:3-hydroxyacyl-CoA dehydrogenase NAD-binding domain-containing protein [Phyllobacterium calauticae]|uniref:3-hydroxyacyl-CoA dehydrogenase NAD-binding domain-containing protein n=1 Tax=Phyllobacterium calauticae TaxID=2817027 RepID=UPI001CBF641D|nr:3-hydroxyacyl-CoA dehydrogenase NAD-binding domain-containing protein [Phyllobacterium calauticae]MBZ3695271.1 3-hydroxyacyl-CoA dehydrogenase [Phyllobacterium calauticae]
MGEPVNIVGVAGAGTMGRGIAHLLARSGIKTILYDTQDGMAAKAKAAILADIGQRIARGKSTEGERDACAGNIVIAATLQDMAPAHLVIEAIIETLDAKADLFQALEKVCATDCLFATNTSSLSVEAIARTIRHPQRFAGLHFFNPAPLMKLVEVVAGPQTEAGMAERLSGLVKILGKQPVEVRDSPGFLVNRCARPFYGEALQLLEDLVTDAATIDMCLTSSGGFPLGPFELIDLVGVDINLAATASVWQGFDRSPRFKPSPLLEDMKAKGMLGRKTGSGFFTYPRQDNVLPGDSSISTVDELKRQLETRTGVAVHLSDGRTARELSMHSRQPVIVLDRQIGQWRGPVSLAFAQHDLRDADIQSIALQAKSLGVELHEVTDTSGLIFLRVAAMLVNEAAFAFGQGLATTAGIDTALKLGLNFRHGPHEMLEALGIAAITNTLERCGQIHPSGRYDACPALADFAEDATTRR